MLFIRGKFLAPDSSIAENGILKCKKTIINKISDEDVFFFSGSKYFFDHLRKEGTGSVDSYLNGDVQSIRARMKADKMFLKNLKLYEASVLL